MMADEFAIDYSKSDEYWKSTDPTINGMLGGFPKLSRPDARFSTEFIAEYLPNLDKSLVCGCISI